MGMNACKRERERRNDERNENSTRTYFHMIRMLGAALYCVVVGIIRDMVSCDDDGLCHFVNAVYSRLKVGKRYLQSD